MKSEKDIKKILKDLNEKILNGGKDHYVESCGFNMTVEDRFAVRSALMYILEIK